MTDILKQPEALRLADKLGGWENFTPTLDDCGEAAKELRRLYEANQDMIKALHRLSEMCLDLGGATASLVAKSAIHKQIKEV